MIAHKITVTVFSKEEENQSKIKTSLLELFPYDLEEEKIKLIEKTVTGFNEKQIKVLEVILEKNKHIEEFLNNLTKTLSDQAKELILKQAESRLDDECKFYLRFSKDKLIGEKELWITDQGNCFHIKMTLAVFPKKREKALEIIQKVFKVEKKD